MYPLDLIMWSLAGATAIVVIGIALAVALVALARAIALVRTGFEPSSNRGGGRGLGALAETLSEGVGGAGRSLTDRLDSLTPRERTAFGSAQASPEVEEAQ